MQGRIGSRGGICGARIYRGLPEIRCVVRSRLVGRSFKESNRLRAQSRSKNNEQAAGCGVAGRQRKGAQSNSTMSECHPTYRSLYQGCIAGSVFALSKEALLCT